MVTQTEWIRSEWRRPRNEYKGAANSIHNDEVAKPLGMRGGTIAGSVHMDQFPPMLVALLGAEWFETGSLSLDFKNATIDQEAVCVMVRPPERQADVQTDVRVERDDGLLVAVGTASVGDPGVASLLSSIELRPSPPAELRMFGHLVASQPLVTHRVRLPAGAAVEREATGNITEPLAWYTGESPWGGPIASPSAIVGLLYRATALDVTKTTGGAVGLFGAIEVRHINGPLMADEEYEVRSHLVAAGASPKTEYVWFDAVASDAGGTPVASMRMQLRYMKASSSLYATP